MSLSTPCSLQSSAVGEPLAGTAPTARTWIVVEQTGPWGRDVLVDSLLPEVAKARLQELKKAGAGVVLCRRRGAGEARPADGRGEADRPDAPHHVYVARTAAGGQFMREGVLHDLDEIGNWDVESLLAGELPPLGSAATQPALFICTHSRRDACCAVHGRALVSSVVDRAPAELVDRIWECSHIGGHRFAPVTLSLPSGTVHGRCSVDEGLEVLGRMSAGRVLPSRMRGRTCFPQPLQSADIAVRDLIEEDADDALDVLVVTGGRAVPVDSGWPLPLDRVLVEVRHQDGRAWHAEVSAVADDVMRAESCGKDPAPVHSWVVTGIEPVTSWA